MPVPVTITLEVRDELSEVGRVQQELSGLWERLDLPPELETPVSLALEEVLSNVLRHGNAEGATADIRVAFEVLPAAFAFEVSDAAAAYDPLARPDPDIHLRLEQRRPGGLGVFIVKKLADELSYQRLNGRNRLRFLKRFPTAGA